MPLLPLLETNKCLPLLHKAKRFIWIEETGEHINELFKIFQVPIGN